MAETKVDTFTSDAAKTSGKSYFLRVMLRRSVTVIGAAIILLLIVVAIFAPLLAPYGMDQQDLMHNLEQPSSAHWLGTDELGRDLLSRVIYGSQISLLVGVVGVTIAGAIGMSLGLIAGFMGSWINTIIMRIIDSLMSLPPIVLMLAITSVIGGGLLNVLVALGIGMMPTYCRLMCGQVISVREGDFITAARAMGAKNWRIMTRHILPNTFPPLLVLITVNLGSAIMMEASLSFLGIGILPPTASWGAMVNNGYRFMLTNPLLSIMPGVAILLVVLAFNMFGDGLRDALDPRLRGLI